MRFTLSQVEIFFSTQATTIHFSKYEWSSKPNLLIFMTDGFEIRYGNVDWRAPRFGLPPPATAEPSVN